MDHSTIALENICRGQNRLNKKQKVNTQELNERKFEEIALMFI